MALLRLFKGELVREARAWVEDELVSAEQAKQILARYGTGLDDRHHHSFGYAMLVGLAILSMGLALLLLVSHNWDELPRALRMGGLLALTLGLNGTGVWLWQQQRPASAARWLFAGSLAYGASIMLIAQIYHLGEHFPDGLYWWALGVLPVACLVKGRLLHFLHWSLATLWLFAESSYGFAWSYPLFLLALVWQLWHGQPSRWLVAALVWGTGLWVHTSFSYLLGAHWLFTVKPGHLLVDVSAGLLFYGVSQMLASRPDGWWRDTAELLNLWLLRGALLMLMVFSFADVWAAVMHEMKLMELWAFAYLAIANLLLLPLMRHISLPRRVSLMMAAGLINLLLISMALWPNADHAFWYAVFINLVLLGAGIRLILRGLELHAGYLFYTGVLVILVQALLRYVNLMSDYLSGALLFVVAGAILFAAARFWRARMTEVQA